MIRLVATDLDGTLLRDDKTINDCTRSVLDAVQERGVHVVPVTARQPRGLTHIADACGLSGWSICANGALVRGITTGEVLFERHVELEAMQALARKYLGPGRSWRVAIMPQGPAAALAASESPAPAAATGPIEGR